jgi:hypothetical protein
MTQPLAYRDPVAYYAKLRRMVQLRDRAKPGKRRQKINRMILQFRLASHSQYGAFVRRQDRTDR